MADYHYHILNQLYRPHQIDMQTETKWWAKAEMNCAITNISSALDSLAHEINLAYNVGLQPNKADIPRVRGVDCLKEILLHHVSIKN